VSELKTNKAKPRSISMTDTEWRILSYLGEDPRMPISEVIRYIMKCYMFLDQLTKHDKKISTIFDIYLGRINRIGNNFNIDDISDVGELWDLYTMEDMSELLEDIKLKRGE